MNALQWEQTPLSSASRAECLKVRLSSQEFIKQVLARMPQSVLNGTAETTCGECNMTMGYHDEGCRGGSVLKAVDGES